MGKKIDPKSIDSLKLGFGVFIWLAGVFGGFLLWLTPQQLPLQGEMLTLASIALQLGFGWLFSRFLLRDRNGKTALGGVLAFLGLAYPLCIVNGHIIEPENLVFYLVAVVWVSAGLTWYKAVLAALLALVPEVFQWMNIHYSLLRPYPPLPGNADPLLFDWTSFEEHLLSSTGLVILLAVMLARLKSHRVVGFKGALPSSVAKNQASGTSGTGPETQPTLSFQPSSSVQVPQVDASLAKNIEENADLRGILESIVFFMSKNFKAHSALGLLSLDEGHTFVINAKFSKSQYIKDNVLIYQGSGIVGKAITEPNGFMTGSVKTYPDKVEYYSKLEEVNSIIISRILDDDTRKVIGLLVVDSPNIRAFEDGDKELLNRFSVVASKLISNARMRKIMESTSKQNEIVYEISKLLTNERYTRGVIGVLIENLRKVFDADRLIVCDFSPEDGKGRVLKLAGESGDVEEGMLFQLDDPFCLYGMAFINKIEYLETDVLRENRYRFRKDEKAEFSPLEVMVAPLLDDQGHAMVVIGLESNKQGCFHKRSIVLLQTIMANASTAITRAQAFTRLEKQATMDGLTKIPNHRHFQETLDKVIQKYNQERRPFGLLLMDIDHFKKFNDTYGHPIGDKVLQLVAATVAKTIRPNDFVARYGGEEFTVILDSDPAQLAQAAERIREAIEAQALSHDGNALKVTVSIGASCFPLDGTTKKELIELSDQAMYHSKKSGRNRVTIWSQLGQ